MRKTITVAALALTVDAAALVQGCSSQQEVTRTETTVSRTSDESAPRQGAADDRSSADLNNAPGTTTTTSKTTTTSSNEPASVLGATAHAIGTVILLPFRLIGYALGLIV